MIKTPKLLIAAFLLAFSFQSLSYATDSASFSRLPRWRGFNLLEKFSKDWSNKPFAEEDFKMISSLGFNFVRLPMDYRVWIKNNDIDRFDEAALREIDRAVEWGGKYGVHVCINFHRAPGYCVNASRKEENNLWTDAAAQKACAKHWAFFAERYKEIPSDRLSFNLFNEPPGIDDETYYNTVKIMAEAIRAKDPGRLIICDGTEWGRKPVEKLLSLKVAQATRGYFPVNISHYKASWMQGADRFPVPVWPMAQLNNYLYAPGKKELHTPLVIEGDFSKEMVMRIRVDTVSNYSRLVVRAGGKEALNQAFKCGEGRGEWKKVVYNPEWKIYQNIYDKDYFALVPAGAGRVEIENAEGDWLTFSEIGLKNQDGSGTEKLLEPLSRWGEKQGTAQFDPSNDAAPFQTAVMIDREYMWNTNILPWKKLEVLGSGIIVGEWGAYNRTPHEVVLAWMKDNLVNWKKAGWGWALWNFRGDFGILDSGRKDVNYEDFEGHKLDRAMLELLKAY